ncbi:hypothetical protein ACQI5H_23200 [Mycobacterium heidelbergense]|uniref:hypothetical protein n=1 Tax=Mycobacterium heidelbergense TaxID=53376 RepID=UPI003CF86199
MVAWYSRTYTVTGTFAQCEAAIQEAQLYNVLAGWWSLGSLVVWNWVALVTNFSARKTLRRVAAQPDVEHPGAVWTPENGATSRWPAR